MFMMENENELKNLKVHFESYLSKEPVFTETDRKRIRNRIDHFHKRSFSFFPAAVSAIVLCSFMFFLTSFVVKQAGFMETKSHHEGMTKKSSSDGAVNHPLYTSNFTYSTIALEPGAEMKISKQSDLFHTGEVYTIGLVNLPQAEGDYKGYLGIWNGKGNLVKKFDVNGYNSMFPVQLSIQDFTNDGNPDILLETDEHANGGNGVHDAYVYVQQGMSYVEVPLPDSTEEHLTLTASHNLQTKEFLIHSNHNDTWTVKVDPTILESINPTFLKQPFPVKVDPISQVNTDNHTLTTKRYLWFGNVQLNSLGFLHTSYVFINGKWEVKSYNIASM
jgi:hypothetical protein